MGDRSSQGREVSVMPLLLSLMFVAVCEAWGGKDTRGLGGGGARDRSRLFQKQGENLLFLLYY